LVFTVPDAFGCPALVGEGVERDDIVGGPTSKNRNRII
jgi:hypothetical protein